MDFPLEEQLDAQKVRKWSKKKSQEETASKQDAHPFDNLGKALFSLDGAQIIPELIEGAQVTSAENVELDRSKLKADLVYRGFYGFVKHQNAVFDLELQSGHDPDLTYRLLLYLAALYEHYRCLIICVIIYMFRCSVVKSPHIMRCDEDGQAILTVQFRVICLWEMDPKPIVARHLLPLYTFLPAMKEPSAELLIEALKEMTHAYPRPKLAYRFTWFYLMLRRTDTVSEQDKQAVAEAMKTMFAYEEIIRDDPVIQNLLAQSARLAKAEGRAEGKAEGRAEGRTEGRIEGKAEGMRDSILSFLSIRFSPTLAAKAQPIVLAIRDYEVLNRLYQQLIQVSDEQTVFLLLNVLDERPQHGSSDLPAES